MGAVKNHFHDELEAARALEAGEPLEAILDIELERCGWRQASKHFDNAILASRAGDQVRFDAEMAAFRAIRNTWNTRDSGAANNPPEVNQ